MPTLQEQRFHTGTVELNYAEGPPTGPPFVLLHGGSARWQYGEPLLQALAGRWHVYAPDLRGHGKSGRVSGGYRLQEYVDDIAAFLQNAVREPAVLYGHSLGGEVALTLAARYPQLTRAVIVADAPLSKEDHPTEEPLQRAQNQLWRTLAASDKSLDEIAAALRDMLVHVPARDTPRPARDVFGEDSPWFQFQAENLRLLDPGMLDAVLEGPEVMLEGYEAENVLPKVACPVLILQADPERGGLQDYTVERALALLPQASRVRLEGIGHELHGLADQVPRVVESITPFLDSVRR
jgi:pimeloyl-ACP methyl ester carboxylesterase